MRYLQPEFKNAGSRMQANSTKVSEQVVKDDKVTTEPASPENGDPTCATDLLCFTLISICHICSNASTLSSSDTKKLGEIEVSLIKQAFSSCKVGCGRTRCD